MLKRMKWLYRLFIGIFLMTNVSLAGVDAQTAVNGLDYAPGLYYQYYDYAGEGIEFAPFNVTLDYRPDENAIYQFSEANAGTTVVYIYQLTDEGVMELSYFPETYDAPDLRYHEDAWDEEVSLVLPANLVIGDTFTRGYSHEQRDFYVEDILATFEIAGITYYDVVVVTSVDAPHGTMDTFYYAPFIGLVHHEFSSIDDDFAVTRSLDFLRGPTYENQH